MVSSSTSGADSFIENIAVVVLGACWLIGIIDSAVVVLGACWLIGIIDSYRFGVAQEK